MPWISLTMETDSAHAEALGDAMLELGALSTDIHDAAAGTEREQFLFDEPGESMGAIWSASELTALFDADADIISIVNAAAQAAQLSSLPSYRLEDVKEQDWVRITQSQFDPIRISSRLWIVPSWHQVPDPAAVNLILDPGMAFGTGSHPSTKLCLTWLDENLQGGEDVLDYGCGSGILAIAASKLGASHVVGIDIDPQAVAASRKNAIINQCDETKANFFTVHVERQAKPVRGGWADVVVANILANPLIMLAPILMRATREGGRIALSGILMEQAEEVKQVYRQWFTMHIAGEQEGWALLTGTRK
ncbi:50S ribosomal protein L11 methyltransferase [Nitrosospira sp. Nl5]|uniref:50S ribosomal protein L11 methyltransferase n=1 Tax=Nitrosospira sp. Nl5 TaxID=200120 RepID=UPI000B87A515|nr:50S ribosomal protein L11 methyltransferase [Nitrosospira sp. Nl5]